MLVCMNQIEKKMSCFNLADTEGLIVNVKIASLSFLSAGLDHILFELPLEQDKQNSVLIFKRANKNKEKYGKMFQQQIQDSFDNIYSKVIQKCFPQIGSFIVKKKVYQIIAKGEDQLSIIFNKLDLKIEQGKANKQIPNSNNISIERKNLKVLKCKNILKQPNYNTVVQFKPKTILPDIYSQSFLKELCHQFEIVLEQLKSILKQAQPVEKLRWYKKNKAYLSKGQKLNMNPLVTFGVHKQNLLYQEMDFTKTKCLKNIQNDTKQTSEILNNSILQLLRDSDKLLLQILRLQFLFPYSPELISVVNTLEKQHILSKQQQINEVVQNSLKKMPENINQFAKYLSQCDCISKEINQDWSQQCKLFLFIISLTWKDISFLFMVFLQDNKVQTQRLYIVDDYLKSYLKVQENIQKDRKLLRNYLVTKLKDQTR